MTLRQTDKRTQRVIDLLTALATDHEPFPQPWVYDQWIAGQEENFLLLYEHHQDNARVRELLKIIDGGSRLDTGISDAVRRAIKLAPQYLAAVLRDTEDTERIGWSRNVAKDTQEYEVGFTGYIQARKK